MYTKIVNNIYTYVFEKLIYITENRKQIITPLLIKSDNKYLSKIKFKYNTTILKLILLIINNIIKKNIIYKIKGACVNINPLDLYTIFVDNKNNGKKTGYDNFIKKNNEKSTLIKNIGNNYFGESILLNGESYPKYTQKYFLEWLFIYSKEIKLKPENNLKTNKFGYINDIFFITNIIDKLYINLINEYFFGSIKSLNFNILYINKYFEEKEKYKDIIFNKSNNINDLGIKYEFLSRLLMIMSKNDMGGEYDDLNSQNRIEFMIKEMSTFDFVKEYFDIFQQMYFRLNSNVLGNVFSYHIEKDNKVGDFKKLIDLMGTISEDKYNKKVKKRGIKYYFGEINNILNKKLYNEDYPFIEINHEYHFESDIEKNKGVKLYHVISDGLISNFLKKIRKHVGSDKFGDFMEEYLNKYLKFQLDTICDDSFSNKYIYGNSKKYYKAKGLELDFYIYNKETKNIILFELKVKDELNDKIHHRKDIINLTKEGGGIYKGVKQLLTHKENLGKINSYLNLDGINNVQYVFINYSKSMAWNTIIRDFIDLNEEFIIYDDFNYTFSSLKEFELLINQGCIERKDFFEILKNKNTISVGPPFFNFFLNYNNENIVIDSDSGKKYGYLEDDLQKYLNSVKIYDKQKYKPFELLRDVNQNIKGDYIKISRKSPCICGSGKKFKRCCGK